MISLFHRIRFGDGSWEAGIRVRGTLVCTGMVWKLKESFQQQFVNVKIEFDIEQCWGHVNGTICMKILQTYRKAAMSAVDNTPPTTPPHPTPPQPTPHMESVPSMGNLGYVTGDSCPN